MKQTDTVRREAARIEKIYSVTTEDSVTLYWEKPEGAADCEYRISCGEEQKGITDKTHITIDGLETETEYIFQVEAVDKGEKLSYLLPQSCRVRTGKKKERLDVTKPPYNAVGNGAVMDTRALQQAIDDCGEGQAVYLPAGVYLTGALRLHSDMELYLEENAVLQGTDRVEDYLPRIWSRF